MEGSLTLYFDLLAHVFCCLDWDSKNIIRQLELLPSKPEDVLRFFERSGNNGGHVVYGKDALFIAETMLHSNSSLKYLEDPSRMEMLLLTRLQCESIWSDLLQTQQFEIEIWTPDTNGRSVKWTLAKRASPGNMLELDDLFMSNHAFATIGPPAIACILIQTDHVKNIALGYLDTFRYTIGWITFVDNEIYSNLESLLVQLNIKEVLVTTGSVVSAELVSLRQFFQSCQVKLTETKPSLQEFSESCVQVALEKLLHVPSEQGTGHEPVSETACLKCLFQLFQYLRLTLDETQHGKYTLIKYHLSQFMRLDSTACRALNIFETNTDSGGSLYACLNQCKTNQGSRLLHQWMRQPLVSIDGINARLDIVDVFIRLPQSRHALRSDVLSKFPDLIRLCRKFERGSASLQDAVRCYQIVLWLPKVTQILSSVAEPESTNPMLKKFIIPLESIMDALAKFVELIETTIDLKATERHEYIIKPEFDVSLQTIENQKKAIHDQMIPEFNKACRDLRLEPHKKIKMEKNTIHGTFFRISRSDANQLKQAKNTYTELSTQKNGIHFTTASMMHLSDDYERLCSVYSETQSSLVKEIISVIATFVPILEALNHTIAELDVLSAFGHVAGTSPHVYVRPTLTDSDANVFDLVDSRHPCVERQQGIDFIPNTIHMDRASCTFQVITGPNMGGKSTYIRQAGVICLMAQIGCPVPASSATLPIMAGLYARVGAGDSQLKGISTFMSEMLEMASILKTANCRSLVIIDELGRGTSSSDGFGIAWSISEFILRENKCWTLFATHFHELSTLSQYYPNVVRNYHVTSMKTVGGASGQEPEILLLYKVEPGIGDQSFGIHVAQVTRFPDIVLQMSRLKAKEMQYSMESVISPEFESELLQIEKEFAHRHNGMSLPADPFKVEACLKLQALLSTHS